MLWRGVNSDTLGGVRGARGRVAGWTERGREPLGGEESLRVCTKLQATWKGTEPRTMWWLWLLPDAGFGVLAFLASPVLFSVLLAMENDTIYRTCFHFAHGRIIGA